jgi:ferric-dicitrate binding protein FerR (iron transport regulator)
VLIAETERIDRVVAAITNYIARRLVERERALASDWRSRDADPAPSLARARAAGIAKSAESKSPEAEAFSETTEPPPSWRTRAGDAFSFLLLALGSMTFCLLIGIAAYAAWLTWGRSLWTAWLGPPPF